MASAETVAGSTRCWELVPSASARLGLQELEWSDVELMFVLMFLGAKRKRREGSSLRACGVLGGAVQRSCALCFAVNQLSPQMAYVYGCARNAASVVPRPGHISDICSWASWSGRL